MSSLLHCMLVFVCHKLKNVLSLQGVCIGLSEVMASAGRHQLLGFMSELIPTIRVALCDRFVGKIISLYNSSFFWVCDHNNPHKDFISHQPSL